MCTYTCRQLSRYRPQSTWKCVSEAQPHIQPSTRPHSTINGQSWQRQRRQQKICEVEVRKHRLFKSHSSEVTNTTKCSKFQRVILFPKGTLGRKVNIISCQTHTSWWINPGASWLPETQRDLWPSCVFTGMAQSGWVTLCWFSTQIQGLGNLKLILFLLIYNNPLEIYA